MVGDEKETALDITAINFLEDLVFVSNKHLHFIFKEEYEIPLNAWLT